MYIGLDRPFAPSPEAAPAPAPTPQQVGQAQASLQSRLPTNAASLDRQHYEAALQEAIRALLAEQMLMHEAQRQAEEEALRRAAILLQAQADAQRGAQAARAGVDPLRQSASELGVVLGSDAQFEKPALDASVSALQRPDVVQLHAGTDQPAAPESVKWTADAQVPDALSDFGALSHPKTSIAGLPDQTRLTLQQAHGALDDAMRAGLTLPEAVNAVRAQLGGMAQTEVPLAEATLAHVGDALAPDARGDRLAQAAQEVAAQFDSKVLAQAQTALHVQLDAHSSLTPSATAARTAWGRLQQDQAGSAPAARRTSDEAAYHEALLHELDDAAGERSGQWRTDSSQSLLQIDRRWQAEQRVQQLNEAGDTGAPGSLTPQAEQQSLRAAEIVATVQSAGDSPGLAADATQAHELDKQLQGAGTSLTKEVEDDARIQQLEQRAARDVDQAGATQSDTQASLVKRGEALRAFDHTRWEATLAKQTLQAPQTQQAIDRLHAPASLQEAAALASALHDASPALAQAAFARNAGLRARVARLIAQGPAPVVQRAGRALEESGPPTDTYFGAIGQLAQALGGTRSAAGRGVLAALARRAPHAGALQHETLDAPLAAYQTLIDAAPHSALADMLEAHTGLTPDSDRPRQAPEDARSAARAELALDDALNGAQLNAKTLPAAFRKAQQQNPTLSTASLVEGTEVALIDSGTTTSTAQGAQLITAAQLVDGVTLKRASASIQEDSLQPASDGASLRETPASRAETGSSAASPVDYLRGLLGHNVNVQEALAATRVWLGGDARREPELMQAALEALGERIAARPHEGDPAQLALAQLRSEFTQPGQAQLAQQAARMAQDASPDTGALERSARESVVAHQRWQQDRQRNGDASQLQADQQAYVDGVRAGLDAAAGHPGTGWQADELNWERLGKAQQAFAQAYVQAAAQQAGSAAGAQQEVTDVQGALEVAQVLAQMDKAKSQGGTGAAAQALTDALRGVAPTTELYRDLLGDGTRAQPGSQAVAQLRSEAARAIGAPLAATHGARNAEDAQTALRLAGRQLDQYRGTVLYAPLVDDIVGAHDTQRTFEQISEQVRTKQDGAARQHALVQATNGLNRELAQALYHKAFADRRAEPAWATKGAAADVSVLYDRLSPSDPDMIALLHDFEQAGESGSVGTPEAIGTPSKASIELGQQTAVFGFGFDHMLQGTPMQLAHDLVALGGPVGTEVSRETGIAKGGSLARAAKPDTQGNLVGLPDAQAQVSVNTQAALLNALGRAEHLQPVRVATSLEQEQQIRDGTLALYSGQEVVYAHGGRRTTLDALARSLMSAEGVQQMGETTPVSFGEQQMSWWDAQTAAHAGSAATFAAALLAGANAGGKTFEIGPADPTARANYAQWQHHSGLADGTLIATPYTVYGTNGQALSDARYTVQHETGDNPWYSRRNLEADAQVGMTVGAVVFSALAAPEAASLWAEFGAMALDTAFAVKSVPQGLDDLYRHGAGDLQGWAELTGGLSGGTLAWLNGVRIAARLAGSSQRFAEQLAELSRLSGQATARGITPYARTERLGRWLDGDAQLAQRTRASLTSMQRGAQRISGPVMAEVRGAMRVNRLALTNRVTGMAAGALNTTTLGQQAVQMVRQGDAGVRDWVQMLSSVAGLGLGALAAHQHDDTRSTDDLETSLARRWQQMDKEGASAQIDRELAATLTNEVPGMSESQRDAYYRAVLGASSRLRTALQDRLLPKLLYRLSLVPETKRLAYFTTVLEAVERRGKGGADDTLWALILSIGNLREHERSAAFMSALAAIGRRPAGRQSHFLCALPSAIISIPEGERSQAFDSSFGQLVKLPQELQIRPLSAHADQIRSLPEPWTRFTATLKAIAPLPLRNQVGPLWELMAFTIRTSREDQFSTFNHALDIVDERLPMRQRATPMAMLASWATCLRESERYAAFARIFAASARLPAPQQAQVAWELARLASSIAPRDRLTAFSSLLASYAQLPARERKGALKALAYRSAAVPAGLWSDHIVGAIANLAPEDRAAVLDAFADHFDSKQISNVVVHPDNKAVTLTFGDDNRQVVATVLGKPGRIPEDAHEFVDLFEIYPTGGRNGEPVVIARIKGSAPDGDSDPHPDQQKDLANATREADHKQGTPAEEKATSAATENRDVSVGLSVPSPDHSVFVLPEHAQALTADSGLSLNASPWTHFRKRATGSIGNAALTALLAPVLAPVSLVALAGGIAALVAERMVGNPIFKQERIGRKAKPFTMYKLHTMPGPGEANSSDGASDTRATPVGRKLRKFIIDELLVPWTNLFKGQMQLFAYRPQVTAERELMRQALSPTDYAVWESVTAQHRPGFLSAHGNMSVFLTAKTPENLRARAVLDVWQSQNTGFRLGLRILADTIRIGLGKVGDMSELTGYKETDGGTKYVLPKHTKISAAPRMLPSDGVAHSAQVLHDAMPVDEHSRASTDGAVYDVGPDTPALISEFLGHALSNNAYDSVQHLERRARNYLRYIAAEIALLRSAMAEIKRPESTLVAQSAWMAHLERGSWLSDEMFGSLDRNRLADEVAGLVAPTEGSPFFGSTSRKTPLVKRRVQIPAELRGVVAMMLRGEQGPLTLRDAQLGVPLNNVAKLIAVKLESAAARERVAHWRDGRIKANRSNTAIANTALGVNLARDVCSQILDHLGLPVATGVSSTLADTLLLARFVAEKQRQPWIAPGLTEAEATRAMTDLGMIEMRHGAVPSAVAKGINELREELGLPPKIVDPEYVFTHSYGELHVGVQLAHRGAEADDADAITAAAQDAVRILEEARAQQLASFSQATVAGEPYTVGPDTPPIIRRFLGQTLSNNRYESVDHLQRRAEAHFRYIDAETDILRETTADLENPDSNRFSQSSWMGHLERGAWYALAADGQPDRWVLGDEVAGYAEPSTESPFYGERGIRLSDDARSAMSMMLRGELGPFTQAQAKAGFECAQTGQVLAGRLNVAERKRYRASHRVDAKRSGTHASKSATGADLSADLGTSMRDEAGLPVMGGTSGSSSDAALAAQYGARYADGRWSAPGLSEAEATQAIADLSHHYFRAHGSGPANWMTISINALRAAAGFAPQQVDTPNVFTHSYPEIYSGVALTLAGAKADDVDAMRRSTTEATRILIAHSSEARTAIRDGKQDVMDADEAMAQPVPERQSAALDTRAGAADVAPLSRVAVHADKKSVTLSFDDGREVVAKILGKPGRIPEDADEFDRQFAIYLTGGPGGQPVVISRIEGGATDRDPGMHPGAPVGRSTTGGSSDGQTREAAAQDATAQVLTALATLLPEQSDAIARATEGSGIATVDLRQTPTAALVSALGELVARHSVVLHGSIADVSQYLYPSQIAKKAPSVYATIDPRIALVYAVFARSSSRVQKLQLSRENGGNLRIAGRMHIEGERKIFEVKHSLGEALMSSERDALFDDGYLYILQQSEFTDQNPKLNESGDERIGGTDHTDHEWNAPEIVSPIARFRISKDVAATLVRVGEGESDTVKILPPPEPTAAQPTRVEAATLVTPILSAPSGIWDTLDGVAHTAARLSDLGYPIDEKVRIVTPDGKRLTKAAGIDASIVRERRPDGSDEYRLDDEPVSNRTTEISAATDRSHSAGSALRPADGT